MLHRLTCLFAFIHVVGSVCLQAEEPIVDSLAIFRARIAPILNSPSRSSCTECHLSGVDLKDYIGESQEETFASLRAGGMIDMAHPEHSKILTFIQRAPAKSTPIGDKIRKQEYEAFRAWIVAASKDSQLISLSADSNQLGPDIPIEVIRHTRQDRIVQSFRENIWSEMGRCVNCHSPELNRRMIGRDGRTHDDIDAISWIVPRDPAGTLQKLVDTGNIDLDEPDASLVLTKPLGLEEHGGGPKFALGSITDKNFRHFLRDYVAAVEGKYSKVEQLPTEAKELIAETGQHLRIVDLPDSLDGRLLRVDLYPLTSGGISKHRIATAENSVNGKQGQWQSSIYSVVKRNSPEGKTLQENKPIPAGRYIAKIFVDRNNQAKVNRDFEMGQANFLGQVEFSGKWDIGYREPKIIRLPK